MSATISSTFRQPTPIDRRRSADRWVIMGDPGVGKTTLAATFPKPLWIDVEGSLQGDARTDAAAGGGDEWKPESFRDLDALYVWAKKNIAEKGYQTLVIDTVDVLVSFLLNEATDAPNSGRAAAPDRAKAAGTSLHDMTVPEQRDYLAVAKGLERFLFKLRMLGIDIVLLSHIREPNTEKGETKRKIDTPPSVQKVVIAWATVVGELTVTQTKRPAKPPEGWKPTDVRLLLTQPGDTKRVCKTRYRALLPAVKNPTYEVFMQAINSEVAQ